MSDYWPLFIWVAGLPLLAVMIRDIIKSRRELRETVERHRG